MILVDLTNLFPYKTPPPSLNNPLSLKLLTFLKLGNVNDFDDNYSIKRIIIEKFIVRPKIQLAHIYPNTKKTNQLFMQLHQFHKTKKKLFFYKRGVFHTHTSKINNN